MITTTDVFRLSITKSTMLYTARPGDTPRPKEWVRYGIAFEYKTDGASWAYIPDLKIQGLPSLEVATKIISATLGDVASLLQ